jgi:hypothetical protein
VPSAGHLLRRRTKYFSIRTNFLSLTSGQLSVNRRRQLAKRYVQFYKVTTLKSILLLSTFLFISCGQDTDTETSLQRTLADSPSLAGQERDLDGITETKEASNTQTDQSTVALTFINSYADNSNKMKEAIGVKDWVMASNLVTQEFRNELNKIMDQAYQQDPELGLGFNPIFDAQDNPSKFVLDKMEGEYLTVRGEDWQDFKLKMKVKKVTDKWLVDGCGIINIPTDKRIAK